MSILFTTPKVSFPRITPTLAGREEIMLPLAGVCRTQNGGLVATDREVVITLDSTV